MHSYIESQNNSTIILRFAIRENDCTPNAKVLIVAVRVNYVSLQTFKLGYFESKIRKQLFRNISVRTRKLSCVIPHANQLRTKY